MSFHILLLFSIVFWTCSNPVDIQDSIQIKNRQFNYLQELNQLYFAMEVEAEYKNQSLFDTKIIWYAISKNNTPDTLNLYDDGSNGDIILGDWVYGLKIKNDSTIIKNTFFYMRLQYVIWWEHWQFLLYCQWIHTMNITENR